VSEVPVTPGAIDHLTAPALGATRSVEVVAYRPTERAVVRIDGERRRGYVKVLPPHDVARLVAHHDLLAGAGLPVPAVLCVEEAAGVVVLAEIAGTTLRERARAGRAGWPTAGELASLLDVLHALPAPGPSGRRSRIADGAGHAALLATVLPHLAPPLDELAGTFDAEADAVRARSGATVHGDVHEGQLVVGPDGSIRGVLDLDDVGAGDPLDDLGTLAAHLRFRACGRDEALGAGPRRRLLALSDEVRRCAADRHGWEAAHVAVAAVLVGLATGPFRLQRDGWEADVAAAVADARAVASGTCRTDPEHEALLSRASRTPHGRSAAWTSSDGEPARPTPQTQNP